LTVRHRKMLLGFGVLAGDAEIGRSHRTDAEVASHDAIIRASHPFCEK